MSPANANCHALLITAHCDDAELWAGGTIARWHDMGLHTTVAIFDHDSTRQSETLASASILGFEPLFRDSDRDPSDWVLELLVDRRPEVLLTHPEWDPHLDHQAVHHCVKRALLRHGDRRNYPKRWYSFDTYYLSKSPTTWSLLVDIGDAWIRKEQALSKHHSQNTKELITMARHAGALLGMRARFGCAEAFYPFDLLGRWPKLRDLP